MSIRSKLDSQLRKLERSFETYNEITVSRSALLHNFDLFQSIMPDGHVIPVLKSNAYGHGITQITSIFKARKFPYIAVDGYFESLVIQSVSKQPVLVMGAIRPENYRRMSFRRAAFVVFDTATVKAIGDTGRKAKIHIEIESGMTRHGVTLQKLPALLKLISKYPNLQLEGVMSHLADADNPADNSYNQSQVDKFDTAADLTIRAGFSPKYFHIAQSAGSVKVESNYANTLRVGIAMYGISPLESDDPKKSALSSLRPVLELKTAVTKVHDVEKGDSVSYGRTYKAAKRTRIGVMPLGYYEGIPRALSNTGLVRFKNEYLPVAGRVCMNHTMVDLGNSGAKAGDEVTLISSDKRSKVSVENICRRHGLFNYALLVGLNQNIRRNIVK